jgi:hypothetical protein
MGEIDQATDIKIVWWTHTIYQKTEIYMYMKADNWKWYAKLSDKVTLDTETSRSPLILLVEKEETTKPLMTICRNQRLSTVKIADVAIVD